MEYRNRDILTIEPDWATRPSHDFENDYKVLKEYGIGYGHTYYDETIMSFKFGFSFTNRADIFEMSEFFNDHWGRLNGFWVPSWQTDLQVTEEILESDDEITISDIKYNDYWLDNDVTGRHLCFIFPNGSMVTRKIIAAPTSTTLMLDAPVGKACSEDTLPVLLVSFLHYVRFDVDELALDYENPWFASCELSFKTIPSEAPTSSTTSTTTTTVTTTTAMPTTTTVVPTTTTTV